MFGSVEIMFKTIRKFNVLVTSIFPCLNELLISCGSRGMITTIAFLHFTCADRMSSVIRPLVISSGKLWLILFVAPRMKAHFIL